MSPHPVLARLREAGFGVVPVLNHHGGDTGLVAWRRDPLALVLVTAWSDELAFAARAPRDRDWSRPFASTDGARYGATSFAEVVEQVLRGRHRQSDETMAAAECTQFTGRVR